MSRRNREVESLKRQLTDSSDEISRLRQHAQRVSELEFIVDSERQTHARLKADHEQLTIELEKLKRDSYAQALERPRTPSGLSALSSTENDEIRMVRNQLADMEVANSRLMSRQAQLREEAEQTWQQKIEEMKRNHSNIVEDLKNQLVELQGRCKRLEVQLSEQTSDAEAVDRRYQQAKRRATEIQEQLDASESDLLSVRSKLKLETALKGELEERVASLEREVTDAKDRSRAHLAEGEQAEAERAQLKRQLRDVTDERDDLQLALQQKSDVVSSLEMELSALKQRPASQEDKHLAEIDRLRRNQLAQEHAPSTEVSATSSPGESSSTYSALEEASALLREEKSKVHRLTLELEDVKRRVETMTSAAHSHAEALQDRDDEIKVLRQKLESAKKQEQHLLSERNEEELKLRSLSRSAEEVKRQLEEEMFLSASKDRKINQLQGEVEDWSAKASEWSGAGRERDSTEIVMVMI